MPTTKSAPTAYRVQRRYEPPKITTAALHDPAAALPDPDLPDLWYDLPIVEARTGAQAIKAAAGEEKDAEAGSYRAFPARNDTHLDVAVRQTVEVTYTPARNAVRAEAA